MCILSVVSVCHSDFRFALINSYTFLKILLGCWSCLNLNSKLQLCLFALNTSPCFHSFSSTGLVSLVLPFLHLSTWPCVFSPCVKQYCSSLIVAPDFFMIC